MSSNYTAPVELLNYVLINETYNPILENELDDTYFPGYELEFKYIQDYYDKSKLLDGTGVIPNSIAFSAEFPDFPVYTPSSVINTIMYDVREAKCYMLFRKTLETAAQMSSDEDSFKAITYAYTELAELYKFANSSMGSGTDIIMQSYERLEDYVQRLEKHGLLGISTGDKDLDKELHGWLPEDFVIIFARTNEGKSWLILFYMLQAWMQGNKVAFYAGEMNPIMMGYRFDTMFKHFSNSGLISGDVELGGQEVGFRQLKDYKSYIEDLIGGKHESFQVFTQRDIGGKLTPEKMRILQSKYMFNIWGLDQLTQMDDNKHSEIPRVRYSNMSQQLYDFTEEFKVPVLAVHQANRGASASKKKDANASPEMDEVFDSDAIMQNATRGVSWSQIENGAKAKVVKNRYGKRDIERYYNWNINYGILEPKSAEALKDAFS